jgi:diguanylate cyclase (GGDEF)-like protein
MQGDTLFSEHPTASEAEQPAVPIAVTRWTARLVDDDCEQDYRISRLSDDRRRFQYVLLFLWLATCFNLAGDLYAQHAGADLQRGWVPYVVLLALVAVLIPVVRRITTPQAMEIVAAVSAVLGMAATVALLTLHPRLGSVWATLPAGLLIIIYFCLPLRMTTMTGLAIVYTLVFPLTWSATAWTAVTPDDMYRSLFRMVLVNILGFSVANTLFRSHRIQFAQNRLLQKLLSTDALTGIANRRHFDQAMAEEWRRCARVRVPLSLLMIDVDYFKRYNDHLGHLRGDECLRQLAAILTRVGRRPGDLVARYGGEEFVYLLPDTDAKGAMQVAERLRSEVQAAGILHPASPLGVCVTVSIGVASALPPAGTVNDLVALADRALYVAKEEGRNRIVAGAAGQSMPQPLQASSAA